MTNKTIANARETTSSEEDDTHPGAQPPISNEPPIPDAEELQGTPRPTEPRPEGRPS